MKKENVILVVMGILVLLVIGIYVSSDGVVDGGLDGRSDESEDVGEKFIFLDEEPIMRSLPVVPGLDRTYCTGADRNPDLCEEVYDPACGVYFDGKSKTFSNGCLACGEKRVGFWFNGSC